VLAGEHAGKLHPADSLFQNRQQLTHLVTSRLILPFLAQFDENLKVLQLLTGLTVIPDHFLQGISLLQDVLGAFSLIPELRLGNFRLQFGNPLLFDLNVKDTPSAH